MNKEDRSGWELEGRRVGRDPKAEGCNLALSGL